MLKHGSAPQPAPQPAPSNTAQGVFAQMKNNGGHIPIPPPAQPQAQPQEEESDSSLIWGVVGGAILLGLFLYKKLHK